MKNLYPSLLARAQLLLLCMCFLFKSHAAITVDSVRVTSSTCPNNGTATIYAHSSSGTASLLYNVVSGPTLYPLQNSNVFISLYPGNYTARVHDVNSFDSVSVNFTITGSYQNPVVSATASAPRSSPSCSSAGSRACSTRPSCSPWAAYRRRKCGACCGVGASGALPASPLRATRPAMRTALQTCPRWRDGFA